ncbi:MAG: protein-L-isoaspartate(D-aspartate) O-methyltransferase [Elusimicrobiota bacterium]
MSFWRRLLDFLQGGPAPEAWGPARDFMVRRQIESRGVRDARVLAALRTVPRHLFFPERSRRQAHSDRAVPIGYGQTISQPYIVAFMTELLGLTGGEKVLEVGTGSGYQSAVLSLLAGRVFSVEVVPELAQQARQTFRTLGYGNIAVRTGNGRDGWPEEAPFDHVLVTAGTERVPAALADQLKTGGRLVIPQGPLKDQKLVRYVKTPEGLKAEVFFPVRFVPFVGAA